MQVAAQAVVGVLVVRATDHLTVRAQDLVAA